MLNYVRRSWCQLKYTSIISLVVDVNQSLSQSFPLQLMLNKAYTNHIPRGLYKLEQLERLRSEDTPAASWLAILLSHIESKEDKVKITNLKNLPKFHIFEFWNKHYTRHIFWSCLIRCANMWCCPQTDRQTDGRTGRVTPVYLLSTSLKRGV